MKTFLSKVKQIYDRVDRAYKRGYNRLLYSCRHMSRLSSEALDRNLTFRERFTRRCHLLMCKWCRRYNKQMRFLRLNVGHYARVFPEHEDFEGLSPEAKERILEKIKARD